MREEEQVERGEEIRKREMDEFCPFHSLSCVIKSSFPTSKRKIENSVCGLLVKVIQIEGVNLNKLSRYLNKHISSNKSLKLYYNDMY